MQFSSSATIDSVERIRSAVRHNCSRADWLDLVCMNDGQYQAFASGRAELPENSLLKIAAFTGLGPDAILTGNVDYRNLETRFSPPQEEFPGPYNVATFGRRRATIISLDFVEKISGWRMRSSVLEKFRVGESLMTDPMGRISKKFLTDACSWLKKEAGYGPQEFYGMGALSAEGNQHTVLARTFRKCRTVSEIYELMFTEMLKFYEQNCFYDITKLTGRECVVEVRSNPYIAEALGVKHLGSRDICHFKRGWMASAPAYIGQKFADVKETRCVHQGKGDSFCEFHIRY